MLKRLLIVPAIALGVLAVALLARGKTPPKLRDEAERATPVRVLEVPRLDVVPRAVGYGEARAGRTWQAVPQVGGRIIELSPRVREGSFVRSGTVLVRVDRSDYDLEVKVAQSRLIALNAQLEETKTRERTLGTSAEIERRSLELARVELERLRKLLKQGTVSRAELDREERSVLNQSLRVQEIDNGLTLLEPQRAVLRAQVAQEQSHLERAALAVERTVIAAPFDCRIGVVKVEQDQVVQPGQVLFSADSTDTSEVTAWLPTRGVRHVLAGGTAPVDLGDGFSDVSEQLGLQAEIRMGFGQGLVRWEGAVVRVRGIDSRTRALGLDVSVANPYEGIVPGVKPPLTPGMYVEVEIRGHVRPDQVAVPRSALHGDTVLLVGADDRLVRRTVRVAFVQSETAVIAEGLDGGERLILTDLMPAVDGTLLLALPDAEAARALAEDASGKDQPQ